MKWRISAIATGVAATLAAASIALAQGVWPTVTRADVEVCRPIFSQIHVIEQAYIRQDSQQYCQRSSQYFDERNCQTMQTWLRESQAQDSVDWYFEGNGSCQGDYPCFGPGLYNDPRTGDEAKRWIGYFEEDAADTTTLTPGMDLWEATRVGNNCIARIWVQKYRGAAAPAPVAPSKPVAVAPTPPPQMAPPASASVAPASIASCIDGGDVTADKLLACASAFTSLAPGAEDYGTLAVSLMQMYADAGKLTDALTYGDLLAASYTGPEAQMTRCAVRVMVKWDLETALTACTGLGSAHAGALEARGQIHLLAGRWQDAWADFDAAYRAGGAGQALYLRGIASAAQGRMGDALKDMADGEAKAPGSAQAYDRDGYSIAAVSKGQPLAPPEAFVPVVVPMPASAVPPPATLAFAPVAPGTARFDPNAPPSALPLDAPRARACEDEVRALQTASAGWQGTIDEISLRLGMLQRTHYATRCAGHPEAANLIAAADRIIADASPRAERAATTAEQTTPVVTDCLELVPLGAAGNNTGSSIFRNSCAYPVMAAYCNVAPSTGSWASMFACETRASIGLVAVPASGSAAVVFGREVNHFACRQPALPVATYAPASGLSGFCK